ncbi:hypothetical protein PGQ11_003000 [Apiospora arundinis]|uniref:Uncharacterized protein n=1 Tax=Apiospora arundinis TaxID=335852 RepID=A0ABR2J4M8_9PEZI
MTCADVGTTNPDIAGLGIILSFTIQAGLSFLLSGWSISIETRLRLREVRRIRKRKLDGDKKNSGTTVLFFAAMFKTKHDELWPHDTHLYGNHKIGLIDRVLRTIGDTQLLNGISLLIGALVQHQSLGLYHLHIVYDVVNFTGVSAAAAVTTTFKRPDGFFFSGLLISLYSGLYLAFTILFGLKLRMWDESVSGQCYNASRISTPGSAHPYVDSIYLGFTALYLFGSLLMCRFVAPVTSTTVAKGLRQLETPFFSLMLGTIRRIGSFNKTHQRWIAKFQLSRAICAITQWRLRDAKGSPNDPAKTRWLERLMEFFKDDDYGFDLATSDLSPYGARAAVLIVALIQYPVHGYMVYALRSSNEEFLTGSSENEWGFGQIVALVLVAAMLLECLKAWAEYTLSRELEGTHVSTSKSRGCTSFLRVLLLGNDGAANPGLPSRRSTGLERRRSLPSDFKTV